MELTKNEFGTCPINLEWSKMWSYFEGDNSKKIVVERKNNQKKEQRIRMNRKWNSR